MQRLTSLNSRAQTVAGRNFLSSRYLNGQDIPNLITVGASGPRTAPELVAPFSNYGRQTVDVFAPGVDIYANSPGNAYATHRGTSMAAPVVAGLAAVLKAYFPSSGRPS